jgi:hypothetical protein
MMESTTGQSQQRSSCKRRRPSTTTEVTSRPSPLVTVDRQALSLILQCLNWREKLAEVSHVSRRLLPLLPADFSFDRLVGDPRPTREAIPNLPGLWRFHTRSRLDGAGESVSPRLLRLLSQVRSLTLCTPGKLTDALMDRLFPAAPTSLSGFSRLRALTLANDCDASTYERLFPSSTTFPLLEALSLSSRRRSHGGGYLPIEAASIVPL